MYEDAVKLMQSSDLRAFDLKEEPESVREAYGNDQFGKGCFVGTTGMI
ncbi:MAG: hypothetical protein AAGJ55_09380 [Cyanobacteria bacterium J06555_12]